MIYKIESQKLVKILEDRKAILDQSRDLLDQKEKLEKELAKLGYKMNKLKDKTAPFIEKFQKETSLEEFDYIARIFIERNQAFVETKNQVQDYMDELRGKKNEERQ